jgi:ribosomal protein S6
MISVTGCGSAAGDHARNTAAAPVMPAEAWNVAASLMADESFIYDDMAYDMYEAEYDYAMPETAGGADGGAVGGAQGTGLIRPSTENRKIVYVADVTMQTKEFDAGVGKVGQMVIGSGGFIQSSVVRGHNILDYYRQGRYAYMTVRVPSARLEEFLAGLESDFNILETRISSDDITMHYFDTRARLNSLQIRQARILELLERAEEVTDLLELEKEHARVIYEIETLTSSLNRMDDSVDFSTINIHVEEVVEYERTPPVTATFGEQLSNAYRSAIRNFSNFWRNFALGFVGNFIAIIFWLLVIAAITIFTVRYIKRHKKARAKTENDK